VVAIIVGLWLVVVTAFAYQYVRARVSLPDAEGYEADWTWQLFFFAITRLPIALIGLFLIMWFVLRQRQPG
jgi:hypothetical protein